MKKLPLINNVTSLSFYFTFNVLKRLFFLVLCDPENKHQTNLIITQRYLLILLLSLRR